MQTAALCVGTAERAIILIRGAVCAPGFEFAVVLSGRLVMSGNTPPDSLDATVGKGSGGGTGPTGVEGLLGAGDSLITDQSGNNRLLAKHTRSCVTCVRERRNLYLMDCTNPLPE